VVWFRTGHGVGSNGVLGEEFGLTVALTAAVSTSTWS